MQLNKYCSPIFISGQRHADCIVDIVNDSVFEPTEQFRLVLGSPTSSTTKVALVGSRNSTILKISNPEDGKIFIIVELFIFHGFQFS